MRSVDPDEVGELFAVDDRGVVPLPALVAGRLLAPVLGADLDLESLLDRAEGKMVDVDDVHLVPCQGESEGRAVRCLALPKVTDPSALVPPPADPGQVDGEAVAALVAQLSLRLAADDELTARAQALALAVETLPADLVELGFADVRAACSPSGLKRAIDLELSFGGHPGTDLLDGWVPIASPRPGAMASRGAAARGEEPEQPPTRSIRAFPTRQLHVTAGNSPVVPATSTLRALATRSAMTVKLPADALVAGACLAAALFRADPDHPLVHSASIVYWRGGDEAVEDVLLRHSSFERIVVWGSAASVESVARRAAGVKTLIFNPRYGLSLVGAEALTTDAIEETARRGAQDSLIWNQHACIASLVHYVEGGDSVVDAYCEALATELGRWDELHRPRPDPATTGRARRARRGELADGTWLVNGRPTAPISAVVRMDREFDLAAHPMSRVVVVRPLARLEDAVELLGPSVSSVGIYPAERLADLRDLVAARGVSCVLPLGEADTLFPGMPHDGMRPLSELVSWAVA